jgi:DNA-binding NtrC family response regulator
MMELLRVLVIDDETVICDACDLVLSEKGHKVTARENGKTGLDAVREGSYDVLLLDMKLPDIDGMDILKVVQDEKPELCTIVMTGYSSISNAVQAMREGADNYLAKPFTEDELLQAIEESYASRSRARRRHK